jgi:hypothetical protein
LRHSSAHIFMCLSSGWASQAFAHFEQQSAQAKQTMWEKGPPRATTCDAAAQIVEQSKQVRIGGGSSADELSNGIPNQSDTAGSIF